MFEINNQLRIDAPLPEVWAALTDFDRYPEWNPVIRGVYGQLDVGASVLMTARSPEGDERQWTCRISRVDRGRSFSWRFTDRHRLLYGGEHTFFLAAVDERTTRYIDRETFQGLLVSRRRDHLATVTTAGMLAMGEALKRRVENSPAEPRPTADQTA